MYQLCKHGKQDGEPCFQCAEIVAAQFSKQKCTALKALEDLRGAISDFKGHGMPGFTDRALAYIVMAQADEVLKRETTKRKDNE